MHPLLHVPAETLRLHSMLFDNCLDGVDDATLRRRPNDRNNHLGFLACHVVDSRYFLAREVGAPAECPFRQQLEHVRSVDDMHDVPSVTALRTASAEAAAILRARFEALSEVDLTRPSPRNFAIEDGTVLGVIAFLVSHEAYHIGQMALLRKYLGLGPMSYAPNRP